MPIMTKIKELKQFSERRIRQGNGEVLSKDTHGVVTVGYYGGAVQSVKFTRPDYRAIKVGDIITVWKRKNKNSRIAFLSQYALIYYNVMIEQEEVSYKIILRVMDSFGIDDLLNMEIVRLNGYFITIDKIGEMTSAGIKSGYDVLRGAGLVE